MNIHWALLFPCDNLQSVIETIFKVFWCWILAAFIFLLPFHQFASPNALDWQVQLRKDLEAKGTATEGFLGVSWVLVPSPRSVLHADLKSSQYLHRALWKYCNIWRLSWIYPIWFTACQVGWWFVFCWQQVCMHSNVLHVSWVQATWSLRSE